MLRKFASLAHPNTYGFAYDSSKWNYQDHPFLLHEFRMFETFGDGLTQHSGDWAVREDYAIDYLESLAVALLADSDLAYEIGSKFNHKPLHKMIEFAASLVFDEKKDAWPNKRRYFNVGEQKVTRSESKQHDKRYQELRDWHNGSPEVVYGMIVPEYADGLTRWQWANEVRWWFATTENSRGWMEPAAIFLKWFKEDGVQASNFHTAFDACHAICESVRLRRVGEQNVENRRVARELAVAKLATAEVA